MALRIKQPKNRDADREHPAYMSGQQQTWADKDRERTQGSFRRNFIAIIAVIVLIAVVLIVAAVSAVIPAVTGTNQISAADTFAISQVEQQKMKQDATTFAQGLLVYSYCSDQATAFEGKNAALALMEIHAVLAITYLKKCLRFPPHRIRNGVSKHLNKP